MRAMKDSGIAWIGEIPEGWEVVRQKNIFSQGKNIVADKWKETRLLSLTTKGVKCIEIGTTKGKVPDSYSTYQLVEPNNIVVCLFDLDCSAVFAGISNYCGMISPAYKILSVCGIAIPKFYDYWFSYIFDGRKYKFLSKNIRYSLTYEEFAALSIILPPLAEQQAIADFLDKKCGEIDELVSLQEKMIEELKAYKQSVITEAVTKGLNPDVPMKDSGIAWIGEIPEGWNMPKVKQVLLKIQDGTHGSFNRVNKGLPLLSAKNITDTNIVWGDNDSLISEEDHNSIITNGFPQKGDVALCCVGTIGRCCIYNFDYPISFQRSVSFLRTNKWILNHYLLFMIKSNFYQSQLMQFSKSSAQSGVYLKDVSNTIICLPPLDEQQAIADFLDEKCTQIDNLISLKQSKIEELKAYKKSLIYEYVTGKKQVV